jgi:hypothetical protein
MRLVLAAGVVGTAAVLLFYLRRRSRNMTFVILPPHPTVVSRSSVPATSAPQTATNAHAEPAALATAEPASSPSVMESPTPMEDETLLPMEDETLPPMEDEAPPPMVLSALPDDVMTHLFGMLRRSDQNRMACVCSKCCRCKAAVLQAYILRRRAVTQRSTVSAGTSHLALVDASVKLLTSGTLIASPSCGLKFPNCLGQSLPDGSEGFLPPTVVPEIDSVRMRSVVAGHLGGTAAISDEGEVYAFGERTLFECGGPAPQRVAMLNQLRVSQLATGSSHVLIVSEAGDAYSYGYASMDHGQLGLGDGARIEGWSTKVRRIEALRNVTIRAVAAAESLSLFLSEFGDVYSCGKGAQGELGHGAGPMGPLPNPTDRAYIANRRSREQYTPLRIKALETRVLAISAAGNGQVHSIVLLDGHRVATWGANNSGQLGLGDQTARYVPTTVRGLRQIRQVAAANTHSFVVTMSGKVYAFGQGRDGCLGLGEDGPYFGGRPTHVLRPRLIPALAGKRVRYVSSSTFLSMAVTEDGEVFVMGTLPAEAWGRYMIAGQLDQSRFLLTAALPRRDDAPEDEGEVTWSILLQPLPLPGLRVSLG